MNEQYFIIVDGQQKGPYPREVLRMQGMTPDTYVWREGMDGWAQASSMPELTALFAEGQDSIFPNSEQQPQQQPQQEQKVQAAGAMCSMLRLEGEALFNLAAACPAKSRSA